MNYEQHTLRELKAMCSNEPQLFRGFSRLCKADLITFMEEKVNALTYIEIPNNQGENEDLLEIYEDFTPIQTPLGTPEIPQRPPLADITQALGRVPAPPVGPPAGPPPWDLSEWYPRTSEQQYINIQETLESRILANFTDAERELMETLNKGRWVNYGGSLSEDMSAHELVILHLHNVAIDELDYNIFQVINDVIEPEDEGGDLVNNGEILALTDIVRRECITELQSPCPECPICYERKPGMMVETKCGHKLCFGCLNETWKARCGTRKWMDRPCPMCRVNVDSMTFV